MLFLASSGYRCIAHGRRGHGRSSQPWNGNEMDTYAEDLSKLIETLDLKGVILIGFSAGGGEVACYIGRHGTKRVTGYPVNEGKIQRFHMPDCDKPHASQVGRV